MLNAKKAIAGLASHEAAGGVCLMLAAVLALLVNNSPAEWLYHPLLETPMGIRVGPLNLEKSLLHWIDDGLMAIFFFLVGLEIKKELLAGALSSFNRAAIPAAGAIGGMIAPALIYAAINFADPAALRGWAIPAATDIAFAVGVLTLLGPRVPPALKVFLLALAILDDIGAILVIAVFYTESLSRLALELAAIGCAALAVFNLTGVRRPAPYLLVGLFIWVCVLQSGVHATLAGVAVAFAIPLRSKDPALPSLLEELEESLEPWVTFGVLPIFAFANAGVSLSGVGFSSLLGTIPLGIALGLLIGKTVGISGAVWLAVKSGLARLPDGATWPQMRAVAILGGIGFTMSLFIGSLAFPDPGYAAPLRIGVLSGSLLSGLIGFATLWVATKRQQ